MADKVKRRPRDGPTHRPASLQIFSLLLDPSTRPVWVSTSASISTSSIRFPPFHRSNCPLFHVTISRFPSVFDSQFEEESLILPFLSLHFDSYVNSFVTHSALFSFPIKLLKIWSLIVLGIEGKPWKKETMIAEGNRRMSFSRSNILCFLRKEFEVRIESMNLHRLQCRRLLNFFLILILGLRFHLLLEALFLLLSLQELKITLTLFH